MYVGECITVHLPVLTLGHDGVSLADPLQGLQFDLPLFEDVENSVRPARFLVAIEQPENITITTTSTQVQPQQDNSRPLNSPSTVKLLL